MRSKLLIAALFAISFAVGCGEGDKSQIEACNEVQDIMCEKFHNCLDPALKDMPAVKAVIGLNAGDCKVKFRASECNADKARCEAGKTYKPDQAEACLSGLRTLSCTDVTRDLGNIPEPAACALVCA